MNWLEFVMTVRQESREANRRGTEPTPVSRTGNVRRFQRRKP
jgi:hypothetical protein